MEHPVLAGDDCDEQYLCKSAVASTGWYTARREKAPCHPPRGTEKKKNKAVWGRGSTLYCEWVIRIGAAWAEEALSTVGCTTRRD